MRADCLLSVEFPGGRPLEAAMKAISHESDAGGRSRTMVSKEGMKLILRIEAQDVVALRAAANACLRSLQIFEAIEKKEGVR